MDRSLSDGLTTSPDFFRTILAGRGEGESKSGSGAGRWDVDDDEAMLICSDPEWPWFARGTCR